MFRFHSRPEDPPSRLGASVALRELIWARGMNRHVIEVLLLILPHKVVDT